MPEKEVQSRDKVIVRTSIMGIAANLLLSGFKAVIGLLANSIAIVLDAVNNLSDALSSVITIIGTKLANRKPDKKHPLGYARIEYLTAVVVAAIVLYAGITSLVESIKKIIHPEAADYSTAGLIIIGAAIAVTLDAVNNLSDALSSVITIIGAKLGNKKPDKKHPLGYGRIEYLSS
ncbi:MAG: cation diffusion facilitator family transporter, partial [Lachnospiraceae bacterium]|nr:cation diffusion facilitator family transporter [Lachnospiraceae bacterium]